VLNQSRCNPKQKKRHDAEAAGEATARRAVTLLSIGSRQ
jgi:hypothetical protein